MFLVKEGGHDKVHHFAGQRLWFVVNPVRISYRWTLTDKPCKASTSTTKPKHRALGGEVVNPNWRALWKGKKVYAVTDQPSMEKGLIAEADM